MRPNSSLLMAIALILVAACVTTVSAQDDDQLTVRVSTFARQHSFIDRERALKFKVMEGDAEVAPEQVEVKPIKKVIIAIDNSKSMKYLLPKLVKELARSLPKAIELPTMVVAFNERAEVMTDFTTSADAIKAAFQRIQCAPANTRLFEVIESVKELAGDHLTHLILITDGADTSQRVINIRALLDDARLTISYLNWGYADPSLIVDEPGYQANGKSRIIKVKPNHTLSLIAERSGGEVINLTSWKTMKSYVQVQLNAGSYLYSIFWHSENPARTFQIDRSKEAMARVQDRY